MPSPDPHPDDSAPPRPIGPQRLRALREAILRGNYPAESDVAGGLASLMRRSEPQPAPSGGPPAAAGPGPSASR